MSLFSGTRLGPYEIVAPLGAGGMGEVYRAKDTRLGREVAIKVLPAEVASDPERLRRFEQEAKAVSALNHPHIVTLHEIGQSEHGPYLVLEKIEGQSLRELLRDGALPVKRVLTIGAQIAEGLAKAHAAGIVHRDLKPENVMVTDDGFAKILDFGLAKLVFPEMEGGASHEMTTLIDKTASGMILGTLGYLSPEQAMGKPADFRSDQFALGALLYELATGERPFHRATTPESLTAVIREEPESLRTKNAALPPQLGWIVERCLSKDPNDRYASTRDLARDLADLRDRLSDLSRPAAAGEPLAPTAARRSRAWLPWTLAVAGVLVGAAGAWLVVARRPSGRDEPATRFTVVPTKPGLIDGYPALSPDGRRMAYALLDSEGSDTLWIQDFTTGQARAVEGTDGAQGPFWSPDGQFIAFFAHSELRRVAVAGGAPLTICPAIDPHGGSWGAHGEILFNPGGQSTLYRIAASGGTPMPVFETDSGQGTGTLRYPWFLPDGDHFLYTAIGVADRTGVYWSSLGSRASKLLLHDFTRAAFDPRGYLLYARDGALLAQRFDPARGELSGEAVVVAEHVDQNPQKLGEAYFDVSPGGTLALRAASARPNQLVWFDRAGKRLAVVASQGQFMEPSLSPDGSRVLVGMPTGSATGDLWSFDAHSTDRSSRLTFGETGISPVWSPDGSRVLFSVPTKTGMRLVARSTNGAGAEETLLESANLDFADEWSRDDRFVLFERTGSPATGIDLWLLPRTGERKPVPYLQTPANESHASLSPDGRYVAYVSDEGGTPQIYVQTLPASGSKWQISTAGGDAPLWSVDGKELLYVGLDRMLMAVPVRSLSPFEPGPALPLFRLPIPALAPTGPRAVYAISRDRQRVLVNALASQPDEPGIRVTLNWKPGAPAS